MVSRVSETVFWCKEGRPALSHSPTGPSVDSSLPFLPWLIKLLPISPNSRYHAISYIFAPWSKMINSPFKGVGRSLSLWTHPSKFSVSQHHIHNLAYMSNTRRWPEQTHACRHEDTLNSSPPWHLSHSLGLWSHASLTHCRQGSSKEGMGWSSSQAWTEHIYRIPERSPPLLLS